MPGELDFPGARLAHRRLIAKKEITDGAARVWVRYHAMLEALCKDWRQLYALYGDEPQGWPEFTNLRDGIRSASRQLSEGLVMRTDGVGAHQVLEGRVLRVLLSLPQQPVVASPPVSAVACARRR